MEKTKMARYPENFEETRGTPSQSSGRPIGLDSPGLALSGELSHIVGEIQTLLHDIEENQDKARAGARRLAKLWNQVQAPTNSTVIISKDAFGIQFKGVEQASLLVGGLVNVKIGGQAVTFPIAELPTEVITKVIVSAIPSFLGVLRHWVEQAEGGVLALENLAQDFDGSIDQSVPMHDSLPRGGALDNYEKKMGSARIGMQNETLEVKVREDPPVISGDSAKFTKASPQRFVFKGSFGDKPVPADDSIAYERLVLK